jgi:hypothetical protein
VEAFTTVKWISVQHGRSRFPFAETPGHDAEGGAQVAPTG